MNTSYHLVSNSHQPGARRGRWALLVGVTVAALSTGCVNLKSMVFPEKAAPPVSQIAATWENKVMYAPDPTHGGTPSPGLAGRLYLFGLEAGNPLVGDGSVVVDLFDDGPVSSGGQPRMLEKWILDKDTVKKLLRRDMIGQGYTLFLPWGTFKPEITHVHLMLTYNPLKGNPLYAPSSTITLNNGSAAPQVTMRTFVPAAAPVAQAAGSAGSEAGPHHSRFIVPNTGPQEAAQSAPAPATVYIPHLNPVSS